MAPGNEDNGEGEEPKLDLNKIALKFLEDHKEAISGAIKDWGKAGRRRPGRSQR
jgi:hypothetical protein